MGKGWEEQFNVPVHRQEVPEQDHHGLHQINATKFAAKFSMPTRLPQLTQLVKRVPSLPASTAHNSLTAHLSPLVHPPMSISDFPQELIDHIVGYLHGSQL